MSVCSVCLWPPGDFLGSMVSGSLRLGELSRHSLGAWQWDKRLYHQLSVWHPQQTWLERYPARDRCRPHLLPVSMQVSHFTGILVELLSPCLFSFHRNSGGSGIVGMQGLTVASGFLGSSVFGPVVQALSWGFSVATVVSLKQRLGSAAITA